MKSVLGNIVSHIVLSGMLGRLQASYGIEQYPRKDQLGRLPRTPVLCVGVVAY